MKKRICLCLHKDTKALMDDIKSKNNNLTLREILEHGLAIYKQTGFIKPKIKSPADVSISMFIEVPHFKLIKEIKIKENLSIAKTIENLILIGCDALINWEKNVMLLTRKEQI